MRIDVVIAPFATATTEEIQARKLLQANLLAKGVVALWAPDVFAGLLDDSDPEERKLGLRGSAALVVMVARSGGFAHVIGQRITTGMRHDMTAWYRATPRTAVHHRLEDLQPEPEEA